MAVVVVVIVVVVVLVVVVVVVIVVVVVVIVVRCLSKICIGLSWSYCFMTSEAITLLLISTFIKYSY